MRDHAFVQLSDLHIRAEDGPHRSSGPAEALRRTVHGVYELGVEPEFFVVSGDLCDRGDHAGYLRLRELAVELFGVPVLLALGNHDGRQAFRDVFLDDPMAVQAEPYFYAQEFDGVRIAVPDSKVSGEVGPRQLDWLRQTLQQPAAVGTIVVVHHPPFLTAVRHMDDRVLRDAGALAAVVRAAPVLGLLHGHTHIASMAAWAGTISVTAPGVAHLRTSVTAAGLGFVEGSGFNLCVVRGGRLTVQPVVLPGTQSLPSWLDGPREGTAAART